jgi:hypothetical protein
LIEVAISVVVAPLAIAMVFVPMTKLPVAEVVVPNAAPLMVATAVELAEPLAKGCAEMATVSFPVPVPPSAAEVWVTLAVELAEVKTMFAVFEAEVVEL